MVAHLDQKKNDMLKIHTYALHAADKIATNRFLGNRSSAFLSKWNSKNVHTSHKSPQTITDLYANDIQTKDESINSLAGMFYSLSNGVRRPIINTFKT